MRAFLLSIPVIGLCLSVGPPNLQAQQCRNQNLRGSYGLLVTGTLLPPFAPVPVPFRRLSRAVFDGAGLLEGTTVASYGGQIVTDIFEGPYTVRPDCTVDFTANVPSTPPLAIRMAGVLSGLSTKLDFMTVDPPYFVSVGRIRKQGPGRCTQADFVGRFQLDLSGQVLQPPPAAPLQFARFGVLTADGAGTFAATTNVNNNGAVALEVFSGTYTVDCDCRLDIIYGGGRLSGVLFEEAEEAFLLQVEPAGAVIGGSLARAARP